MARKPTPKAETAASSDAPETPENGASAVPGAEAIAQDPPVGGNMITTADDNAENGAALGGALEDLGTALENAEDLAIERMLDRMMVIVEGENKGGAFQRGSLIGDIRDAMLDVVRQNPRPFGELSEGGQKQVATAYETFAKEMVVRIARLTAKDQKAGHPINAKLDSYTDKGGVKVSLSIGEAKGADILELHRLQGKAVLICAADTSEYQGQRRDAAIDPDQAGFGFEGGNASSNDDDLGGELDANDKSSPDGFHIYDVDDENWLDADDKFTDDRSEARKFDTHDAAAAEVAQWNDANLEIVAIGDEPTA